jgi:hypothetical protein
MTVVKPLFLSESTNGSHRVKRNWLHAGINLNSNVFVGLDLQCFAKVLGNLAAIDLNSANRAQNSTGPNLDKNGWAIGPAAGRVVAGAASQRCAGYQADRAVLEKCAHFPARLTVELSGAHAGV